jgi:hypothetical protein
VGRRPRRPRVGPVLQDRKQPRHVGGVGEPGGLPALQGPGLLRVAPAASVPLQPHRPVGHVRPFFALVVPPNRSGPVTATFTDPAVRVPDCPVRPVPAGLRHGRRVLTLRSRPDILGGVRGGRQGSRKGPQVAERDGADVAGRHSRRITLGLVAGSLVGLAGGITWVGASIVGGLACGARDLGGPPVPAGADVAVRLGFAAMVLGPLLGWVAVPASVSRRRWVQLVVLGVCAASAALVMGVVLTAKLCR